ncbi:MAG: tetratricopeptide repeat protein [Myxococcales bacterium]|nr:tetratricopeptide repeat protein [Myxococcales bacterium]
MRILRVSFLALALIACDKGGGTTPPDEQPDEDLGDGKLTGQGPGGVGEVLAGMADADPKVIEAEALMGQGKYERALETIDAAIAERPDYARFHYVRGNALTYLDRDDEALVAYQKAVELDPKDAMPHAAVGSLIGLAYGADTDAKNQAIEHLQTALKLDPELAAAHMALGVVLLDLGRYQDAIAALENADRLQGNVETAYNLAQAHARAGNDDKALEYAKSAIQYEPNAEGADIRLLYARLLMKAGRMDDAIVEFEQIGKLVPESPPLRLEVARGLMEAGAADAAMVHMQWLLDNVPNQAPVLVNYARILQAQGKPKEAIVQFDAALALDPTSQAARTYRIEALVADKQCKVAKKATADLAKELGEQHRAVVRSREFLAAGKCK